jgi:mannose-6-phosphate isomerase-like protein (cupin superfamily)
MPDTEDTIVQERLAVFPYTTPARTLRRSERLLLQRAQPGPGPHGAMWSDVEPVQVVRAGATFRDQEFAPPRWIYQGPGGRIEWTNMNSRQPIYHRNLDVDEMAYQVTGHRTLMTELGTAELRPGDFVRIPCGVCHDNWGRNDIHVIWYLPEGYTEEREPVSVSEARIPPFEDWKPAIINEMITDCLGSSEPDHDVAAHRSDERLILEQVHQEKERLAVLRVPQPATDTCATSVIWRGATALIEVVDLGRDPGLVYTRHRNADDIQFQVSGTGLLVTQHGSVELQPGDFVRIPVGVAATSIAAEQSRHISTLVSHRLPRCAPQYMSAEWWDAAQIARYREQVLR